MTAVSAGIVFVIFRVATVIEGQFITFPDL
jgi:hypothetical protein